MSIAARLRLASFLILGSLGALSHAQNSATRYTAIHPGEVWLDTSGKSIDAHGGGILYDHGTYYWYGEMKDGPTYRDKGGTRVDVTGVSCYASKDLMNWTFIGNVLPAKPGTDLDPKRVVERPKVIYNAKTGKFVMWFHADSLNYGDARSGVAVADKPTGPFTLVGSFRPDAGHWPMNVTEADKADPKSPLVKNFAGGQMARDFTIFVDDDQKAYLIASSENNATLHISELTDDYLNTTGKYIRILVGRSNEAPAMFKWNGKYYLITSGCTGWLPNPARSASAPSIGGPWTELGNPCRGPESNITYHGQSTFVLPIAGRPGEFVFMADRWNQNDLQNSRYLWLPLKIEGGKPVIEWTNAWTPDVGGTLARP